MLKLLNSHISFKPGKALFDRKPKVPLVLAQDKEVLIFQISNN